MLKKIKEIINEGKRFLITAHIDPDGDAIGSTFSLYWALNSMGKQSVVYLKDEVPYKYKFLPQPSHLTRQFPDERFDAVFVLDCGSLFRVGDGHERLKEIGPLINIDHHKTNEPFGAVNVVDETACCTAEILYFLYEFLNLFITPEMATNIYTAILTDTGSFRFENTNSNAFIISEKMLMAGVKPAYVSGMAYNSHPKERFKLLGLVLSGLETFNHGKVAMAYLTEDMFKESHAGRELSDGFVEHIKEIRGLEVAVLFRQVAKGYKISMRSKGVVDVARICSLFGGGGHKNAAGCIIEGDLETAKKRIKEALEL
ncbi:MAG: bifunctional oligoribonuclease/PAP phosphatase NrnA [Syntrophobacterales bacterium]|jgi:phosphoesterase RecJ-like protein|nr:bifunctional oligoribonuclease/PAP phosphatase NrnA [Syntrophobacterales bacterium]